jgi:hypothetical protein
MSEKPEELNVVCRFCHAMAKKHNMDVDDIVIGIDSDDEGKVKLQVMTLEFNLLDEWIVDNGL